MNAAPPSRERLFAALDATWPPLSREMLGEWALRRGDRGGGRRTAAVWPAGDPGMALEDAVAAAEARMRAWGQPLYFQIGGAPDAELDAALATRGYADEAHCSFLAAPVGDVAAAGTGGRMVVRVRAPLALFDEMWAAGGIGPARRAVMDRVAGPKETILIREDDRVAAACFVAVHDGIAVMSALHVAPRFRRRGVGRASVAAAAGIGAELGAEWMAFSVEDDNAPAVALYAGLGFREAARYHYRTLREDRR